MQQKHLDLAVVCFEFHLPPLRPAKTKIERDYPNEKGAIFLYGQTSAAPSLFESSSLTPAGATDAQIRFSKAIRDAGLCPAGGFGEPRWDLAEEGVAWMSLESPWDAGADAGWASGLVVPLPAAADVRALTVNLGVIDCRHDSRRALGVMDEFIKNEFHGHPLVSPLEAIEISQEFHQRTGCAPSLGVSYQVAFAQRLPGLLAARRERSELFASVAATASAYGDAAPKKALPAPPRL